MLVVSGGVSVGPHDHVKPAFEACGVEEVLWRVQIKPGKPLWFGRRGRDAGLRAPRQPAVEHRLLLRVHRAGAAPPAGRARRAPDARRGRLTVPAGPSDNRTTFLTSKIVAGADGVLEATPTERQGSHMTGALGESDGFAVAPHGSGPLEAGAAVDLLLLP